MDCICSKPRIIHCKIILLDEQEFIHETDDTCIGQALLDVVFRNLNLLETAYFGLRFLDQTGQTHWLDPAKALNKQIKGLDPFNFYFGVKFYAADPCKLLEEITRYQFFLQVKQDILQERLLVPFELAAELGAYVVQSELGDYDPRRHSKGYVSEFRFLPNQSIELETKIAELHKTLVGQLPSVAELNYLEKVKWLEMYGVDLHPVLGEDNVEYFLGLTPSGIIVLRNKTTVGNYYWPRITKIYFKGRYFMLRVIDKNNDESTYGFETPSKSSCKHLWKCCVEHHAFFRLVQVTPTTPDIFALGSRFRYSGRTEKQAVRDAQLKVRTPPSFSRTPSKRYQRRIIEGMTEPLPIDEIFGRSQYQPQPQEMKFVSVPQPAQNFGGSHPTSFVTSNEDGKRADSPRSIKSAPWSQPHSKGLYNNSVPVSPRSVRSAGPRYRSSSLDSQSSNDSRSCKKRKHRNKLTSDNESELSKSSNRSHRKHRRRRSKGHRRDSESEQEVQDKKYFNKIRFDHQYELVNSDYQWQEVQRKLCSEGNSKNIQQANVISSKRTCHSTYIDGGNGCEIICSNKVRKHRKHRSRSRSPSEPKSWLSEELKKHLEFDLIDTTGMSDSQLKEIPYTVIQTNKPQHSKLRHSQWNKSIHEDTNCNTPPPPYSPHITESPRIRNVCLGRYNLNDGLSIQLHYNENDNSSEILLPRMFNSLEVSDISTNYSHQSKNKDGPGTYNNHTTERRQENTNNHSGISHEHTDSGLGTEQDCIYNTEKSSERRDCLSDSSRISFNNVNDYILVSGPERLSDISDPNTLPQANCEENTSEGGETTANVDLSEISTEL